ncbi:hypothetical protein HYW73_02595 [Candidatus Nomurabacteria bacterium]|nr:hypothetical protein [Candidatus Nomurabacteria bacterium]
MNLENSKKSSQAENLDKTAGKPEIKIAATFSEYINSRFPSAEIYEAEKGKYASFLKGIGLEPGQVKIQTIRGTSSYIDIQTEYVPDIEIHQIFPVSSSGEEEYELEDLVFVNKKGKVFNTKSLVPLGVPIVIDPDLQFKAWGGSSINIPPFGRGNPPKGFSERAMWNVYKKVEALTLFHEIAHTRQALDFSDVQQSVEAERDAWRFGLQCIRKLRDLGVDLLPEVNNKEIISRLELGLLRYDSKHSEDLPKRFSSKFRNNIRKGVFHDFRHFLKFLTTVLKIAKDDPSLVVETLSYKK